MNTAAYPPPSADSLPNEQVNEGDWQLYVYRDHTLALLRRYLRLSLELGRLPSLLGGEMFRARVTAYRVASFEDLVIFVHDIESCLNRLSACSRLMIARVVFQEYTVQEVAAALHCTARSVNRWYYEALDETSRFLLRLRLMEPFNEVGERMARQGVLPRGNSFSSCLPPRKPVASESGSDPAKAGSLAPAAAAGFCLSRGETGAIPRKLLKTPEI